MNGELSGFANRQKSGVLVVARPNAINHPVGLVMNKEEERWFCREKEMQLRLLEEPLQQGLGLGVVKYFFAA